MKLFILLSALLWSKLFAAIADIYTNTPASDLPLNYYPMVMTHDSATGEATNRTFIVADWSKTQDSGLVSQLDCGARAFDYRPLYKNNELIAHHGEFEIHKTMESTLQELIQWCNNHPTELVILYLSHFDGDNCQSAVLSLLQKYNITVIQDCALTSQWTYATAKSKSALPQGGSLLSVINCMDENFDESITCYSKDFVCYDSWPKNTASLAMDKLQSYMLQTTTSGGYSTLWMAQAHWQSTVESVALGTLHKSSLLLDESRAKLNYQIAQNILNQQYSYLNMLEVDNVCDEGNALLTAIQQTYLH